MHKFSSKTEIKTESTDVRFSVPENNLFVIIGNIGCGKTTMIDKLSIQHGYQVIKEPVTRWIECGFLNSFYENMGKYALSFQMFAFATRAKLYKEVSWNRWTNYFADAHIISDRHVFAESLKESGFITEQEMKFYDEMLKCWQTIVPEMDPRLFIYLRADPETCKSRIKERGRKEEENISIEYLRSLHDKFEKMVQMDQFRDRVVTINVDGCEQAQVYQQIMEIISKR